MPKVSVIIPVYNVKSYLQECLDSVIHQTLREIEIICVDDGSTDGSMNILREYAAREPRMVVLEQQNRGAGAARNRGLAAARGKYWIFLDSDDFFDLDMLSACFEKLEEDGSDVVVFQSEQYNIRTGERMRMSSQWEPKSSPFSPVEETTHIFNMFQTTVWNKMFRASFVLKHGLQFQEIPRANDMYFSLLSLALARKISVIPRVFLTYRTGMNTNLQATAYQTPESFWQAFKSAKSKLRECGLYEKYEQSFLNLLLSVVRGNLSKIKNFPAAYVELCELIRKEGEQEFAVFNHPTDYYFSQLTYIQYCCIFRRNAESGFRDEGMISTLSRLRHKKVIVYGMGQIGLLLIPYLHQSAEVHLLGACTSSTAEDELWSYQGIELPVRNIRQWRQTEPEASILVATTEKFYKEIIRSCQEAGVGNILVPWPELLNACYNYEYERIHKFYEQGICQLDNPERREEEG